MTLENFIKKVVVENNLKIDEKAAKEKITEIAKEKATNNCACLDDEEVKKIIIDFANGNSAEAKEEAKQEKVKNEKENIQDSLFDL